MPLDPRSSASAQWLRPDDDYTLPGVIGTSASLREVARITRQVAPSRACVLIVGETGTGKELIAALSMTLAHGQLGLISGSTVVR